MKLREISDEDLTKHALSNGGRNVRIIYKELLDDYNKLRVDLETLPKNKAYRSMLASEISDLEDRIISMFNVCLDSQDDTETREMALNLKSMQKELKEIFDTL